MNIHLVSIETLEKKVFLKKRVGLSNKSLVIHSMFIQFMFLIKENRNGFQDDMAHSSGSAGFWATEECSRFFLIAVTLY